MIELRGDSFQSNNENKTNFVNTRAGSFSMPQLCCYVIFKKKVNEEQLTNITVYVKVYRVMI